MRNYGKRLMTGALLGAVIVATVATGSFAREAVEGHRRAAPPPAGMLTEDLDLTEAQRQEVEALLKEERVNALELQRKGAEGLKALRRLEESPSFDESAVRRIAEAQAGIVTELMVRHAKTRQRIYALLTPEQQAMAQKIPLPPQQDLAPGLIPPPAHHGGGQDACPPPPPLPPPAPGDDE